MKEKKEKNILDIYMGGEKDPEKLIIPKDLGKFFDKRTFLIVFFVLLVLLIIAGVGI